MVAALGLAFMADSWASSSARSAAVISINVTDTNEIVIAVVGPIEEGDDRRLRNRVLPFLTREKTVKIFFHSYGGNVGAAMDLGRLIWDYGWRTYVAPKGKCFSACALAWAGGNDGGPLKIPHRVRPPYSELGIHGISPNFTISECYSKADVDKIFRGSARVASKLERRARSANRGIPFSREQ
jgi:hypothetical protein